ncbi:MAG: hypothetical protein HY255_11860, partial [Betaproteobacteria bacterium]|nr:hypothetical protein [Betaproteobacteria bacterium]
MPEAVESFRPALILFVAGLPWDYCIPLYSAYDLLRCTTAIIDAEITMNFVAAQVTEQPLLVAVHHLRAQHPLVRHAYRLSQVITYGVALPQV